ncbi:hypothetical protein Lepto7375DRAFT_3065 [Leptolyngbya sp. PCC 7375]|nr:hypothetical protein Lepto7375DRAFT_3065 [Leptolyngbya sp. PCC 7375]
MTYRHLLLVILMLSTMVGCRMGGLFPQRSLVADLQANDRELSLASIGPNTWDHMCVLAPYTTNNTAQSTLGFPWDVEVRTGIEKRDDIYVLVFVNEDQVAMYLKMPRHEGDLLHSETLCFEFSDETLYRDELGNWTIQ